MWDEQIFKHAPTNPLPWSCPPGLNCPAFKCCLDLFVYLVRSSRMLAGFPAGCSEVTMVCPKEPGSLRSRFNSFYNKSLFNKLVHWKHLLDRKLFKLKIDHLSPCQLEDMLGGLIQILTDWSDTNSVIAKSLWVPKALFTCRWLRCTTPGGRCQRTRTTLSWEDSRQR